MSVGSRASTGTIPITAMSLMGNRLWSPSALHRLAADAEEADLAVQRLAQRAHQLEAELIARMLARDERDLQSARSGAAHDRKP